MVPTFATAAISHGAMAPVGQLERLQKASNPHLYAIVTREHLEMLLDIAQKEHQLLVVDYFAPWCRACRRLLRQIERMSKDAQYQSVLWGTVDFDNARELCRDQEVERLPTLEIYKDGQLRQRWKGANKQRLLDRLSDEMESTTSIDAAPLPKQFSTIR